MANTADIIRRGQAAELRERRAEVAKRHARCRGDVVQYSWPEDPLDPVMTTRDELVLQAAKDMVGLKREYEQLTKAIKELEG